MDTRYGTEPLAVLKIEWPDGDVHYSDKALTIESTICMPTITAIGNVSGVSKSGSTGEYSSVGVSLADTDGAVKARLNRYVLDGIKCTVYTYYNGLALADLLPLLVGKMSEANWASGVFEFSVETEFKSKEVGYAPELDAFEGFNNDVAGKAWPLCFGTVLEVPAIRATKTGGEAILQYGWPLNADYMGSSATHIVPEYDTSNGNYIFPVGEELDLFVGGLKLRGTFGYSTVQYQQPLTGGGTNYIVRHITTMRFVPSALNVAIHENASVKDRQVTDADYNNLKVFWVHDVDLTGQYVLINGAVNFVEQQQGEKCYCRQEWANLIVGGDTVNESAAIPRGDWPATYILKPGDDGYNSRIHQRGHAYNPYLIEYLENGAIKPDAYYVLKSAPVTEQGAGNEELYVCNLVPSHEIVDVWAYRYYDGRRIYAPVPISRYTKLTNYPLNGYNVTALVFPTPLNRFESEQWEDDIFVTVRSTLSGNPAYAIKHVAETYTSLGVDAGTFGNVAVRVNDFQFGFALTETVDAIALIEEMAKQARCAIVSSAGIVKLKFLPDEPQTLAVGNDWAGAQSLQITTSAKEDVRTKIIAKWRKKEGKEYTYTYVNNDDVYGVVEEDLGARMFNMEYCVKAFADFWGYRLSNIWRRIGFRTFMNALDREVYDGMEIGITQFSANSVRGTLIEVNHDSGIDTIDVTLEMASRPTDVDGAYEPIEDANYWQGNPAVPTITDPAHGRTEVDYIPPVVSEYSGSSDSEEAEPYTFSIIEGAPNNTAFRNEPFTLRFEIVDTEGVRINYDTGVGLALVSGDPSDTINYAQVVFYDGYWSVSDFTINGGSGIDATAIQFTGSNVTAYTYSLTVKDQPVSDLTWSQYPAGPVTRGEAFTVAISNGDPDGLVGISMTTNGVDKLYSAIDDTELLGVVLDGSGEYSGSVYVNGDGGTDKFFALTAYDILPGTYGDAVGDNVGITGIGIFQASQSVMLSGTATTTKYNLVITADDPVTIGDPFSLSVELYDGDSPSATSFTANVTAIDDQGYLYEWTDGGPNAIKSVAPDRYLSVFGDTSGQWAYDQCQVTWDGDAPTAMTFVVIAEIWDEVEGFTVLVTGQEGVTVEEPATYAFLVQVPGVVARGTPFDMTVTAMKNDAVNTDYAPVDDALISMVSTDPALIHVPTTISPASWVDGVATVSMTVDSASSDSDNIEWQVEEGLYVGTVSNTVGTTTWAIDAENDYVYATGGNSYYDTQYDDAEPGRVIDWAAQENEMDSLFLSDAVTTGVSGSARPGSCTYEITDREDYMATSMGRYCNLGRYSIGSSIRTSLLGGALHLDFMGREVIAQYDYSVRGDAYYLTSGSIRIDMTTDPAQYNYGSDFVSAPTPGVSYSYSLSYLNYLADQLGARQWSGYYWYITSRTLSIPLTGAMLNYISNMAQDNLYITAYLSIPLYGYGMWYSGGGDGIFSPLPRGVTVEASISDLELYTT